MIGPTALAIISSPCDIHNDNIVVKNRDGNDEARLPSTGSKIRYKNSSNDAHCCETTTKYKRKFHFTGLC